MEALMHFLWKNRMFGTTFRDGDTTVEVISPGRHNVDAGPDFSSAVVKVNGQTWAGNVEMHIKASDWYHHGHHLDRAYDNTILHVVCTSDKRVERTDGTVIPQVVVNVPSSAVRTADELRNGLRNVRCAHLITTLPSLNITDWIETLAIERLQEKSRRVEGYLKNSGGDWDAAVFITLARALGFGVNSEPFEILARRLPLKFVRRHSDNLLQVEALVLGTAGLLRPGAFPGDDYYQALINEYRFLAAKYGISPLNASIWKFARMRPQNQPYRRLALLAAAIASGDSLRDLFVGFVKGERRENELFNWKLSEYWRKRFTFGSPAGLESVPLGAAGRQLLMINVVAPVAYLYASVQGEIETGEKSIALLENLPAERNSIIETWKSLGITPDCAFRSQALIHLRRQYCDCGRCFQCRFGATLLRKSLAD